MRPWSPTLYGERFITFRPPSQMDRLGEVLGALHTRMADLFELLVWKLALEGVDEAGRRLPGRVGDDVQLDGLPACSAPRRLIG